MNEYQQPEAPIYDYVALKYAEKKCQDELQRIQALLAAADAAGATVEVDLTKPYRPLLFKRPNTDA